ncbi:hypothetical protein L2E82_19966 [Cichorium intybus]|uniref:Uncharacterized protein n=1 Tax=Cichorium intybus TaxID=13427 RepID=A0ACB9DS19_CICIN|nr:hypothetical protein L2E82_19966 [Cichorium intybus]
MTFSPFRTKNGKLRFSELKEAILGQITPEDSWGNIEIDLDYGDITKSNEQKPGTRKLEVPRTKPILGICSCDRGRHVIKRDGQLRACPLAVFDLFVMAG